MSAKLRSKLKKVEDDLAQLRTERVEKVKARDTAREQWAASDDQTPDSEAFKSAEQAVRELGEIDDQINDLTAVQTGTLRMLGESSNGDDPAPQRDRDTDEPGPGWNSKALFPDEIAERLKALSGSSGRFGNIELGQVADREAVKAEIGGLPGARRGSFAGVQGQMRRQLRVLDLIPGAETDANSVPYVQEGGTWTAAEVAEGGAKPETGATYTDATAQVQTIAEWAKIRKQVLSDISAMRGIVDTRLRYGVQRRLEGQVLNGNGTDPNIRGILNTSGIGSVAYAAGPAADLILSGITAVLLAEGEADGIVLHPTDWQGVMVAKGSDGHYLAGGPFTPVTPTLWGVPLLPSPAIPVGTGLVGDFGMGATLFVREGVSVLMSDSDQDDFIKNRVTLLAELRAALAVWRPAAFASVDFTA